MGLGKIGALCHADTFKLVQAFPVHLLGGRSSQEVMRKEAAWWTLGPRHPLQHKPGAPVNATKPLSMTSPPTAPRPHSKVHAPATVDAPSQQPLGSMASRTKE